MQPDGTFVFRDPTGRAYPEQLPWPGSPDTLADTTGRADIDGETCIPLSDGTRIDYDADVLMQV